jgi:pimeloyl-ACP methyl ester carboxylesterase
VPFVDAAGVEVHYVEHGPPAAEASGTAVLLHGFTPDHRLMTGCCEPVFAGDQGWRRIYLDLPGMGRTAAPPDLGSTDHVFEVVRTAVQRLVPEGRYVLVGESYGGYLARGLVAADLSRVAGLALICPMVVAEHERRDVPAHRVLVRDSFAEALPQGTEFDENTVRQTEQTYRRMQEQIVVGLDIADEPALDRIRETWAGTFALETAVYGGPALFVLGRQDSVVGYRDAWRILESYPRATFAVLDLAGHNAQIEQPELFETLLGEWLGRVRAEALGQPQ